MKKLIPVLLAVFVAGCALDIDNNIQTYNSLAHTVSLGDSKQSFLARLYSTQSSLASEYKKRPEAYIKDGVQVEIYYMRSARQPDGLTTDDEFVPYLFNDGVLVGIGWTAIGGPKTQGQTNTDVYVDNSVIVY